MYNIVAAQRTGGELLGIEVAGGDLEKNSLSSGQTDDATDADITLDTGICNASKATNIS